jgi:hypothetical protein
MEYKRISGKVIGKRDLEIRRFIDKKATEKLDKGIRRLGGIVCKRGIGAPSGYKEIGGHFFQDVYIPKNVSLDGCISVTTSYNKEKDKEFEISLDEASQEKRGSRAYFPNINEDVVVYVCSPEVAEAVDNTLEKLALSNPDTKSTLDKVREVLR